MVNIYAAMLTTRTLEQALLKLGFTRPGEAAYFQAGSLQVYLLDAPRLLVHSPSGVSYIAVLSLEHLAHQLGSL